MSTSLRGSERRLFRQVPRRSVPRPLLPLAAGLEGAPSLRPVHQLGRAADGVPTASMLNRALPEGVLENAGIAGGFLYFQKVDVREDRATFLAGLQEPTRARQPTRQLAAIDIPFRRVDQQPPKDSPYTAPRAPDWMDN